MFISELLAGLGEHFIMVAVGCVEAAVAVGLGFASVHRKKQKIGQMQTRSEVQGFLDALDKEVDEAEILLRINDRMPVYVTKNTGSDTMMKTEVDEETLWTLYMKWDGKSHFNCEYEMQDGRWIACEIKRNDDGLYDLLRFKDISKEHQMMDDYEERLKHAEQESQSKTSFLSRMSHEIRTPMKMVLLVCCHWLKQRWRRIIR